MSWPIGKVGLYVLIISQIVKMVNQKLTPPGNSPSITQSFHYLTHPLLRSFTLFEFMIVKVLKNMSSTCPLSNEYLYFKYMCLLTCMRIKFIKNLNEGTVRQVLSLLSSSSWPFCTAALQNVHLLVLEVCVVIIICWLPVSNITILFLHVYLWHRNV